LREVDNHLSLPAVTLPVPPKKVRDGFYQGLWVVGVGKIFQSHAANIRRYSTDTHGRNEATHPPPDFWNECRAVIPYPEISDEDIWLRLLDSPHRILGARHEFNVRAFTCQLCGKILA
jgi:hypothetical protein